MGELDTVESKSNCVKTTVCVSVYVSMCLCVHACSITLKKTEKHYFYESKQYKQYSPILASNFEQKGQENKTSCNLQYCCVPVRVKA